MSKEVKGKLLCWPVNIFPTPEDYKCDDFLSSVLPLSIIHKKCILAGHWWLILVILATGKAEIGSNVS
jgi:hypothetical protein